MKELLINQNKKIRNLLQEKGSGILPGIILLCLTLLFLHKLVSLKFITIGHVEDHLRLFYPYRTYDAEMLKSLTIPLWNPYTFGGFPYLASFRCHIFYPLNLIFLLFPTHLAMNVNYILQIFLSGIFMYGLAKALRMDTYSSLASAVSFMFCGFFIDKVSWGHLTMLGSACWLPLIFLLFIKAVENKKMAYGVGAGIIFAVQLFSGHPQLPYYGILTLFLFTLYSTLRTMLKRGSFKAAGRPAVYFLILVFVGIALTAVQLIPVAEIALHSFRASLTDRFEFFTRWSMEFPYMATFTLPRLSPIIGTNSFPFPVSLGYIGILPLVLAIISLSRIRENEYVPFFWILAFIALILALGRYTPIYYLFYKGFPGFDSFRNPIFFLYLYVFSISVLAGYGMSYLQHYNWRKYRKKLRIIIFITVLICFLLTFISTTTYFFSSIESLATNHGMNLPGFLDNSHLAFLSFLWMKIQKFRITLIYDFAIMAFILGTATLTLMLWNKLGKQEALPNIIIISLIFFELFLYGRNHIRVYNLTPFVSKGKWVDYLKKDKELYRVLPMLPYPEQDPVLKLNKISSINGYGSLEILQNYVDFLRAFQEQPVVQEAVITRVANYNSSQALNLLNTKYILTDKLIENDQFRLVFTDEIPTAKTWDPYNKNSEKIYVYLNNNALPRAFFVHSMKIITKKQDILRTLKESEFDPRQTIIIEKDPGVRLNPVNSYHGAEVVKFDSYKQNEFTLKAAPPKNCFLFLSEIYYPGWKVFVDNEQKEIYKANFLFRAIHLEKGFHVIKFVFDPYSYKIGRIITLITMFILIVYFNHKRFAKLLCKIWRTIPLFSRRAGQGKNSSLKNLFKFQ